VFFWRANFAGPAATEGNPWLRGTLTECVWAAAAKMDCFLKEKFWRHVSKSGGKRAPALIAVAHTLLEAHFEHVLDQADLDRRARTQ
jgi:hypothetical protein